MDIERRRAWTRLLGLCLVSGLLLAGLAFPIVGGLGALALSSGSSTSASSSELERGALPAITTVTDRSGSPIAYLYDQNRSPVPSSAIAPTMKAAIVAIEDRRFYSEPASTCKASVGPWSTTAAAGAPRARPPSPSST